MKTSRASLLLLCMLLLFIPGRAIADLTETLPEKTLLLDVSYMHSWLSKAYDNNWNSTSLIDEIERYEPGGGLQGVLTPDAKVQYSILLMQLNYGILDDLSVGIGIPLVLYSSVSPQFSWDSGDYQPTIGRAYSEQDFWDWAASMGQPKPGDWSGNKGKLSDINLGLRFKWTHRIDAVREAGWASTLTITGALPTGSQKDPEEITSAGTGMWDLHSQGELCFHLAVDKSFEKELDDRLTLGMDFFYEVFFEHDYTSPRGTKNPLLLNQALYIGEEYSINPGDFSGFSFQADITPYKGPARQTWLTRRSGNDPNTLPPVFSFALRYTFVHIQQSDWTSNSVLWDYDQEDNWRPGAKNILYAQLNFAFLRLGAPLIVYAGFRTLSLIPGKNTRSSDVLNVGIRVPMKFW